MRSLRLPAPHQLPGDGSVRAGTAPCLEHVPQGDAAQPPGPCPQGHQPTGGQRGLAMLGHDGLGRSTAQGEGCGAGGGTAGLGHGACDVLGSVVGLLRTGLLPSS